MKRNIAVILLALFPQGLQAAGTTAAWLGLPGGTRQAAFSGSLGALAEGVDAAGANPAGLTGTRGGEISLLHDQWAQDLSVEHLAYAQGFESVGFAVAGDYLNFGQVPLYDIGPSGNPQATGAFSPLAMDLYGAAAVELFRGLSLGAGGKMILQSLESGVTSSAPALDLGVKYRNASTGLALGLALMNLGGTLDGAPLPLSLDIAGACQVWAGFGQEVNLGAGCSLGLNDRNGNTVSLGAEYLHRGLGAVRAGYRFASYGNLQGLAGLSGGVGVHLGPAELAYSLTTLGDLGAGHQISLSYRFGGGSGPLPAPSGLTSGWEEGKMLLAWEPVREREAVGYNLYMKGPNDSEFKKKNARPLEENGVTLKRMKRGAAYTIGITTVGRDGKESAMSILTVKDLFQ